MPAITPALATEDFCYITTTGRRTGNPHTIEIWFAINGTTLYILAGDRERSDTIRNATKQPDVSVRIAELTFSARARIVDAATDEDALARRRLLEKYNRASTSDLDDWGRDALPLALDLV